MNGTINKRHPAVNLSHSELKTGKDDEKQTNTIQSDLRRQP